MNLHKTAATTVSFMLAFTLAFLAGARGLALSSASAPAPAAANIAATLHQEIHFDRQSHAATPQALHSDAELRTLVDHVLDCVGGLPPEQWQPADLETYLTDLPDYQQVNLSGEASLYYEYVEDATGVIQVICRQVSLITVLVATGEVPMLIEIERWME